MMRRKRMIYFVLVAILAAMVCFLRLWRLGDAAYAGDYMDFYRYALNDHSIVELWRHPPWLNQIPLNETFSLLMVKVGFPATPFVTRLPFAIMGILTVFFLWRFAYRRFRCGAAFCVLVLAALNPFQIYFARTSYHYAGATCWSAAMFMVFWRILEKLKQHSCPPVKLIVWWTALAILACHMHMSVWIVAAVQGLIMLSIGFFALRENRQACWRFVLLTFGSGLLLLLAISRWIYRAIVEMQQIASGDAQRFAAPFGGVLKRLFPAFFAGANMMAISLLIVFVIVALIALVVACKRKKDFAFFGVVAGLQLVLLIVYIGTAGGGKGKETYFSAIWPLFIWFLGIGIWQGAGVLAAGRRWLQLGIVSMLLGAYAILTLPPAWAIVNLDGKFMPIYKINDWVSNNLPTGTPILVDNWLAPWNYIGIHNTNQINYTFTVPDAPLATYRSFKWRETVTAFFKKFPQAALLEINQGRYDDKVGTWDFPETHFSRTASITNAGGLVMHDYRVFPLMNNSVRTRLHCVSRFSYNTEADILDKARRENQALVRLFGAGWRYLKPWQPMQGWPEPLMQALWLQVGMYADDGKMVGSLADLQKLPPQRANLYLNQGRWGDYRIPGVKSTLRLFNLTHADLEATLTVTGIALSGPVRCMIGSDVLVFPPTLMVERKVPLTLTPGENEVVVALPENQFMLVHDVRLAATDGAP